MKRLFSYLAIAFSISSLSAYSQTMSLEQAKAAFNQGDYDQAAETLAKAADAEPKNATLNHMAGVALMRSGDIKRAKNYLNKGTDESLLFRARIAIDEYDFDGADELVEKFETARTKGKRKSKTKQPVENPAIMEEVEMAAERGRSMMERVEKIVVIDSIAVNRDDFFKAYRLAASAGKISGPDILPQGFPYAEPTTVHTSQDGESMIWALPDSTDNYVLAEASRLADGSWEGPSIAKGALSDGGDVNYPFLMSDGVTLYFASDGEGSLGGYDIYISRRDGDGFLQPQNLGMPYNSPFDDYLLAIDEETGTGWWATDRNQLGDYITVYRFIPSELRVNYPADTPNLASLAKLSDYRATWEDGADYSELLASPKEAESGNKAATFRFAMPDGRIITSLGELKNRQAKSALSTYLDLNAQLTRLQNSLAEMRAAYSRGDRTNSQNILNGEQRIETLRKEIARKRNEVVSAEMN